jgi:hypothetical protein
LMLGKVFTFSTKSSLPTAKILGDRSLVYDKKTLAFSVETP